MLKNRGIGPESDIGKLDCFIKKTKEAQAGADCKDC
jgi:hypothetical protein